MTMYLPQRGEPANTTMPSAPSAGMPQPSMLPRSQPMPSSSSFEPAFPRAVRHGENSGTFPGGGATGGVFPGQGGPFATSGPGQGARDWRDQRNSFLGQRSALQGMAPGAALRDRFRPMQDQGQAANRPQPQQPSAPIPGPGGMPAPGMSGFQGQQGPMTFGANGQMVGGGPEPTKAGMPGQLPPQAMGGQPQGQANPLANMQGPMIDMIRQLFGSRFGMGG